MQVSKSRAFVLQKGTGPDGESECQFRISTQKLLWLSTNGPAHAFYNVQNVPFAVAKPCAIFKGLERGGHENSYCYVAKPRRRFISDTVNVVIGEEWVFLVFVTPTFEIFDWRFERADTRHKEYPEKYEERFKELVWKSSKR